MEQGATAAGSYTIRDIDAARNGHVVERAEPVLQTRSGRAVIIPGVDQMASTALPIGSKAPSFSLRRTFEETVSLDDLLRRGPVVVAFYVFDFGNI